MITYRLFLAILIAALLSVHEGNCSDPSIQWASELHFAYNDYDSGMWSGRQVLGPPDARPLGQLHPNAFRIREESGFGKIVVEYDNPMPIRQIIIVENYLPGRISKISVFDELNNEYLIHNPKLRALNIQHRILSITIDETPFPVTRVALNLSTYNNPGWAQIDAIGIAASPVGNDVLHEIEGEYNYIFNEELTFIDVREKLGKNVNSMYNEVKPLLSPDGRTMYFVREYTDDNVGGAFDAQDIYYSNWINEQWTIARNIGKPLNDEFANGICTISLDGNTMWVQNAYNADGTVEDGISVTHRTDSGWSNPQKLYIEDFHNYSEFQDYYLSNDGRILLLAVEREDTHGDQDIYVSFRLSDEKWSKPRNLGGTINTSEVEYAPFIAPDNLTLFFSSNGHASGLDSDIYFSKRLDDSWSYWTTPEPLPEDVNTEGWDGYFTMTANTNYAFFVSDYSKQGSVKSQNRDIYTIGYTTEPPPENLLIVKGKITEEKTGAYIEANIVCNAREQQGTNFDVSNRFSGRYKLMLDQDQNYAVEVISEGYMPYYRNLNLQDTSDLGQVIEMDIALSRINPGQQFELHDVFFVQSKPEILPESKPALDNLSLILRNNPSMVIQLSGHTDNIGSSKANLELSKLRADQVKAYLLSRGIDERRIKTAGFGSKFPKFKTSDPEVRKQNRRVEVKILKI